MRSRLVWLAAFAGALLPLGCSCGGEVDRGLSWQVQFANDELRMDATRVTARIIEGGCAGGTTRYSAVIEVGAAAPRPPLLAPGLYGFAAQATDVTCLVVAGGCSEQRLPTDDGARVITVLEAIVPPVAACAAEVCMAGVCPPPPVCDAGGCMPEACNSLDDDGDGAIDEAFDLTTDVSNCGVCGNACSLPNANESCTAGRCTVESCAGGWGDCDASPDNGCEAETSTVLNCGGCGIACTLDHATARCDAGVCAIDRCDVGWGDCDTMPGTGCEADLRAPERCGACETACVVPAPLCGTQLDGTPGCVATCGGVTPTQCGMRCVNTESDPAHCGGCDMPCVLEHAVGTCAMSTCNVDRCDTGFEDCNGIAPDGCEVELATDPMHCGECTNACTFPNAMATCTAGSCTLGSCLPGFEDCNGDRADGCEINTAADEANCGRCGDPCPGSRTCCSGTCQRECM